MIPHDVFHKYYLGDGPEPVKMYSDGYRMNFGSMSMFEPPERENWHPTDIDLCYHRFGSVNGQFKVLIGDFHFPNKNADGQSKTYMDLSTMNDNFVFTSTIKPFYLTKEGRPTSEPSLLVSLVGIQQFKCFLDRKTKTFPFDFKAFIDFKQAFDKKLITRDNYFEYIAELSSQAQPRRHSVSELLDNI